MWHFTCLFLFGTSEDTFGQPVPPNQPPTVKPAPPPLSLAQSLPAHGVGGAHPEWYLRCLQVFLTTKEDGLADPPPKT